MYIVGFDIGGTNIRAVLMQGKKVIACQSILTPLSKQDFIKAIHAIQDNFELTYKKKITHVGFGIAGVHDTRKGVVVFSPNLPFIKGFLVRTLASNAQIMVRHDNDARCFLRAEMKLGVAKNKNSVVALTLGTGLGGAIAYHGEVVCGSTESAGEFGHNIVGKDITFETIASKKFFSQRGIASPKAYAQKVYGGNMKAKKIYQEFGVNVGILCANIINAYNPDMILLGGGISRDTRLFLSSVHAVMQKYVFSPRAQKTSIKISSLGEYAGAMGARFLF